MLGSWENQPPERLVGWLKCLTPSCLRRGTGGDRGHPRRLGERETTPNTTLSLKMTENDSVVPVECLLIVLEEQGRRHERLSVNKTTTSADSRSGIEPKSFRCLPPAAAALPLGQTGSRVHGVSVVESAVWENDSSGPAEENGPCRKECLNALSSGMGHFFHGALRPQKPSGLLGSGEGGGRGRLYTYRYTVTTRMTPALRWAAMRAILMFY